MAAQPQLYSFNVFPASATLDQYRAEATSARLSFGQQQVQYSTDQKENTGSNRKTRHDMPVGDADYRQFFEPGGSALGHGHTPNNGTTNGMFLDTLHHTVQPLQSKTWFHGFDTTQLSTANHQMFDLSRGYCGAYYTASHSEDRQPTSQHNSVQFSRPMPENGYPS